MYTIDALILKKEPAGEADCLVTALTSRFARIRLVAQGARKGEAKLKGHLEPLSFSRLSFVVGRSGYRLVGAELLDFLGTIKGDCSRFRNASEITRLLDSGLFEDTSGQNAGFFASANEALLFLNDPARGAKECEQALLWFKLAFLKELGVLPSTASEVRSCADFVSAAPMKNFSEIGKLLQFHLL